MKFQYDYQFDFLKNSKKVETILQFNNILESSKQKMSITIGDLKRRIFQQ